MRCRGARDARGCLRGLARGASSRVRLGEGRSRVAGPGVGLDPAELVAFLERSQADEWEQLTQRLGGAATPGAKVADYVGRHITQRGTIDALRGVTTMNGVDLRRALLAPANGLTESLWELYAANRPTAVRARCTTASRTRRPRSTRRCW